MPSWHHGAMTDLADSPAPGHLTDHAGLSEPTPLADGRPGGAGPSAGRSAKPSIGRPWPGGFSPAQAANYAVLTAATVFIFVSLNRAGGLWSRATPTGGDMGAHVWGPAYLKDTLLASFRLSGWSQDWYAGFPVYTFYMVVPALAIVALDVGLPPLVGIPLLALSVGALVYGWSLFTHRLARAAMVVAAVVIIPLCIDLDPNVAFKLVTVSGLLAMPWAAYFLGTSLRLRFPGPMMMVMAALVFVWDSHFTIYGGNAASTMAGEFSFSIALALALVFLGVVARGLETGRHASLAVVLFGLVATCHVIPTSYAIAGALALWVLRFGWRQLAWVATVGVSGTLLASFWIVPFFLRRAYLNDMGWERLGPPVDDKPATFWQYLLPNTMPYHQIIIGLAVIGAVLSIVKANRAGLTFLVWTVLGACMFLVLPQGRFWNARVLPFYILSLDLLAAVGVTLLIGALASFVASQPHWRTAATGVLAGASVITVFLAVALPLGLPPTAKSTVVNASTVVVSQTSVTQLDGRQFGPFLSTQSNVASSWATWNFAGLEAKDRYPEFSNLITTMRRIGEERGCGRAMWEYYEELGDYGTPMAPMMLPYFTDGCIGSMEGLYFEASMTTPFHFLNQALLSADPSRAMRNMPYQGLNVEEGVKRLQLYGVKYYLSRSKAATDQARALTEGPDAMLTEVAEVPSQGLADDTEVEQQPWVIFEVADSELVSGLDHQPVVMDDVASNHEAWLDPTVAWYNDSGAWSTFLAADGPKEWTRVSCGKRPGEVSVDEPYGRVCDGVEPSEPVTPAEVSDIVVEQQSMSFTVDEVGKPVLVKMSYFPNWRAEGAEGPYRVAPNLMVVVPTENDVTLTYGRSWVEVLGAALSLLGLVIVVSLLALKLPRFRRAWQFAYDAETSDPGAPTARRYYARAWPWRRKGSSSRRKRPGPDATPESAGPSGRRDPDATLEPSPDWIVEAQAPADVADDPGQGDDR